jgi:hypothetical protein
LEGLETRQLLSTFTVVLPTDNFASSGGEAVSDTSGDLRYCIALANAAPAGDADTITFDPTLFATPLTIALGATLTLSDSNPLTIQGPTAGTASLSGGNAIRVLDIASGTVNISDLTIFHGNASGIGPSGDGGGILNSGALTLTDCILDHDVAARNGGGILNSGDLTLTDCILDHDVAANAGGGLANLAVDRPATLTGCIFDHDSALDGGGVFTIGHLTMNNCNLSNDLSSGVGGGGLWVDRGPPPFTTVATVTGCTFSNDTTDEDGGGVFVDTLTTATFSNCTLSNDFAGNAGGGLCTDGHCTVEMTQCNISNDSAAQGGGVCNSGSTVGLTQCTLSDDAALPGNGGGGGLLSSGTSTLMACTFSNNSAPYGGGMDNEAGQATLTNCTFSDNRTTLNPSFGGGGIYNSPDAGVASTISLTNCTLANNSAGPGFGGGIWNVAGCTLNLTNTIVAENTAASGPDVFGSINTADHNLIGDGGGSTIVTDLGGNLVGGNGNPVIDPRLGPLQDNGGPTQTLALYADSPAIGNANTALAPATDQRGQPRLGDLTDIGAYEYS